MLSQRHARESGYGTVCAVRPRAWGVPPDPALAQRRGTSTAALMHSPQTLSLLRGDDAELQTASNLQRHDVAQSAASLAA